MRAVSRFLALASLAILAACASRPVSPPAPPVPAPAPTPPPTPVPTPPAPPPPANALEAGVTVVAAPTVLAEADAARALAAFRISCPQLMRRPDRSGLTQPGDWNQLCADASSLPAGSAAAFFRDRFDWVRVGEGKAFATGYYEPELAGSRTPLPGYVPIYRTPTDLIRCTKADGTTGRGRYDATNQCVLYFTRAEIEDGALANKGLELAWAADPVELFFLQIQGSGRVRMPDGAIMRIGYATQNGHPYTAIGRLLRERGIIPTGVTMQRIVEWLHANPADGRALMRENASYVFFRELTGPGPLGSLNVPVSPRASVAVDPRFIPYGAPVLLSEMDRPETNGLWVAQDTGGAIRGANRVDTFWGAGSEAALTAGGMQARGRALILIPRPSWERLRNAAAQR